MGDFDEKEVDFKEYCDICKWKNCPEEHEICSECLEIGARNSTKIPIKFEKNDKK